MRAMRPFGQIDFGKLYTISYLTRPIKGFRLYTDACKCTHENVWCNLQVNMSDNEALPNMFRTLPALNATERHLMDYLDSNDPRLGLSRVSMYIWDRQRSIRQDMAWQKMEVCHAAPFC